MVIFHWKSQQTHTRHKQARDTHCGVFVCPPPSFIQILASGVPRCAISRSILLFVVGKMEGHHHRSTYESSNKPFKGSSKGKLRRKFGAKGRVDIKSTVISESSIRLSQAKEDRLNHAKQLREKKRAQMIKQKRTQALLIHNQHDSKNSGSGAPLIVAILPLSASTLRLSLIHI
jgi:hypothetical protein